MEVLTSILQQGAEFNSLADTALGDRYNRMLDLITTKTPEGDFPIMMALVNSTPPESMVRVYNYLNNIYIGRNLKVFTNYDLYFSLFAQDELAEALVLLFDYKNELAQFLIRVFQTEVCVHHQCMCV